MSLRLYIKVSGITLFPHIHVLLGLLVVFLTMYDAGKSEAAMFYAA